MCPPWGDGQMNAQGADHGMGLPPGLVSVERVLNLCLEASIYDCAVGLCISVDSSLLGPLPPPFNQYVVFNGL